MVYFHHRRFAESKRSLEEILKENSEFYPGYLTARNDRGTVERSRRRVEILSSRGGVEALRRRRVDVSRRDLSKAVRRSKRPRSAELKVVEITSRKLEASLDDIIVMSRLAEAYARFGSTEEANATLKRVLELKPNDGLAVYNCSCAYALLGREEMVLNSAPSRV